MDADRLSADAMIGATFARITLRAIANNLRTAALLLSDIGDRKAEATTSLPSDDGLRVAERIATEAAAALADLEHPTLDEHARLVLQPSIATQLLAAADLLNVEFADTVELHGSVDTSIGTAKELAADAARSIAKFRADSANSSVTA